MALLFLLPNASATEFDAQWIIDHLYVAPGMLPINDMVIELEESIVTSKNENGSYNLVSSGKDKIYFKSPHNLRIEVGNAKDDKKTIILNDGINAWQYSLSLSRFHLIKKGPTKPYTLCDTPTNIPFGLIHCAEDTGITYTTIGTEKIDNKVVTVIKITSPMYPREEIFVYVDTCHWIPLKLTKKWISNKPNKEINNTVLYKKITRTKEGYFFPSKLELYINETLKSIIVYKFIIINVGLSETLFDPASLKDPSEI